MSTREIRLKLDGKNNVGNARRPRYEIAEALVRQ